jgi:hypothetical protein
MPTADCWALSRTTPTAAAPHPAREFGSVVSPHNHSDHSIENMGFLNQVVKLRFMRPFRGLLQSAFGLAGIADLNYADIFYRSPLSVEDVFADRVRQRRGCSALRAFIWVLPTTTKWPAASSCCARIPEEEQRNPAGRGDFHLLRRLSFPPRSHGNARGGD